MIPYYYLYTNFTTLKFSMEMLFHTLITALSYISIEHTEHLYIYRLYDTPHF